MPPGRIMRAIVVERYGGPDVLQVSQREVPRPGAGQLLVDVVAASVNVMDIYQRQGAAGYAGGLPYVPGDEGAGVIAAVGFEVSGFAAGDRVAWASASGSYAIAAQDSIR
jgi:NADPH2:quinone reductase